MKLTNTAESYGLIHQSLHWATAILILVLLPMGVYMHDLPIDNSEQIADKVWFYSLHKSIGMAALFVALVRIAWAVTQPHPRPLHGGMEGFAAKTVHYLLYGTIIAMPVLGWLYHAATEGFAPIWWPFSQDLPFVPKDVMLSNFFKTAHFVCGVLLVLSLGLHIAGAIKHAVIDKDKTLDRMVPGRYEFTGDIPPEQKQSPFSLLVALFAASIAIGSTYIVYNFEYASQASIAGEQSLSGTQTASENSSGNSGAGWNIDYANSPLQIEVAQLGTPVTGTFSSWNANVIFDPDDLENANIVAEVDVTSLTLGDVSDRAKSAEFLDVATHPTARFTSTKVEKTENGYAAVGELELAGVTKDFVINFTFEENNGAAIVEADAIIQRLDFSVGKTFADDSSVGRSIKLKISISATAL
ncbi:MAG: YceI family protein [Rhizobiaceae bacterium]|nr:YceI family protein [Rhizobiaceae bacterium]